MDHGERAIVPLNYLLIGAAFLLWAVSLPLWTTLAIALPIAVALGCIAMDKYGGMQVCLVAAPAWMAGTMFLGKAIQRSNGTDASLSVVALIFGFLASAVGFAVVLLIGLVLMVGVILAWEWGVAQLRRRSAGEPASGGAVDREEEPPTT